MPVSSLNSRWAAAADVSPGSTPPPTRLHLLDRRGRAHPAPAGAANRVSPRRPPAPRDPWSSPYRRAHQSDPGGSVGRTPIGSPSTSPAGVRRRCPRVSDPLLTCIAEVVYSKPIGAAEGASSTTSLPRQVRRSPRVVVAARRQVNRRRSGHCRTWSGSPSRLRRTRCCRCRPRVCCVEASCSEPD